MISTKISSFAMSLAACAAVGWSPDASAQVADSKVTALVPDDLRTRPGTNTPLWDYTLSLSANVALAQNRNIVGQIEGTSLLAGFGVVGTLSYLSGPHDFQNTLTIIESFAKTPTINQLVKAGDVARLENMYSYYLLDWIGPFARLTFEAPLLETEDVQAEQVIYRIDPIDGDSRDVAGQDSLELAGAFSPLTLTQSIGLVAKPLALEPATFTIRLGAGARETLADGVLINQDDDDTDGIIEIVETDSVIQAGVEAAAGIRGKITEQRLTYGLDFGVLLPLANNDAQDRDAFDLIRIGLAGSATYSMWEWLGLTYQLRLQSDPQLVEGLQVQNNLFITFKYDIIPARKIEAPVDPVAAATAAAAAAEERAKAAEERANAAEQRAKAIEERSKAAQPETTTP